MGKDRKTGEGAAGYCSGSIDNSPLPMAAMEGPGHIVRSVNSAFCRLLGKKREELIGISLKKAMPEDDRSLALLEQVYATGESRTWIQEGHAGPHPFYWSYVMWPILAEDQTPAGVMVQVTDITEMTLFRKHAAAMSQELMLSAVRMHELNEELAKKEETLRESKDQLDVILQNTPGVIYVLDLESRYTRVNRAYEELFELSNEWLSGKSLYDVFPPEVASALETNNRKVLESGLRTDFEESVPFPDGLHVYTSIKAPLRDAAGNPNAIIGISIDITERKRLEEEIKHMAHHDALTGMPNRRFFVEIAHVELAQARRNRKQAAVLFLDLDRFKEINDVMGHETGDALLKEVAARLKSQVRESDTVARIGGDEFNVLLSDLVNPESVVLIARKIIDSLRKPHTVAGHELQISASIGISLYPEDATDLDTLLRYADIALYYAKDQGRNNFQFYNPAINVRSLERMRLENSLQQSLEREELEVYYQPQVDMRTGKIANAEALVRWRHPELGLLEPKDFLSSAEETGFITAIDKWVLKTACIQTKSWLKAGFPSVGVTVNLSARHFQEPEMVKKIADVLKETGLPSEFLDIEITETLAMSNIERTIARLNELVSLGVHISIDDFGTGYSSLNYLKRLPIQKLKIDQSFIRDIATDADDRQIIRAVTAMAHNMKILVLAEGVETQEQLEFLRLTDCDEVQGFLFSRPLPIGEFRELAARG